jgi:hypothetical protein
VLDVWHAMEGHDRDLAPTRLRHGRLELLQRALWLAIEGLRHQQRIILGRIKGLRPTRTSQKIPTLAQQRHRHLAGLVARVTKGHRLGDDRLHHLLNEQGRLGKLSPTEGKEAEALTQMASMLTILKLGAKVVAE